MQRRGSGYFTAENKIPVRIQLDREIKRIHNKNKYAKIIAYFQAYSNTYAELEMLKKLYGEALKNPFTAGVSIATRPDCLPKEIMDYLEELSKHTFLTVELGLQTIHEKTSVLINRGNTFDEFLKAFFELKSRGIRTVVHIINGLPDETEANMLETAKRLGELQPDGVKVQLLHIISNTKLFEMYKKGHYAPLSKDEYVEIVVKQLEVLHPKTVIERITGDGNKKTLVAPLWSIDKISILGAIDKMQKEKNTWQGKAL